MPKEEKVWRSGISGDIRVGSGDGKKKGRRKVQISFTLYFLLLLSAPEPTQTHCPADEMQKPPSQRNLSSALSSLQHP